MKKLEFRAWAGGVMVYFDLFTITSCRGFDGHKHFHRTEPPHLSISDACNIMQYTGVKDKNGKEIYDGDIVRATANGNRKYEIVWMEHGLGHWWIADIAKDNLIPNKIPINLNAIEVIGNIHENPELLKSGVVNAT